LGRGLSFGVDCCLEAEESYLHHCGHVERGCVAQRQFDRQTVQTIAMRMYCYCHWSIQPLATSPEIMSLWRLRTVAAMSFQTSNRYTNPSTNSFLYLP